MQIFKEQLSFWLYLAEEVLLTSVVQCLLYFFFQPQFCKQTSSGCGTIATQSATELCSFIDALNIVFPIGGVFFSFVLSIRTTGFLPETCLWAGRHLTTIDLFRWKYLLTWSVVQKRKKKRALKPLKQDLKFCNYVIMSCSYCGNA